MRKYWYDMDIANLPKTALYQLVQYQLAPVSPSAANMQTYDHYAAVLPSGGMYEGRIRRMPGFPL